MSEVPHLEYEVAIQDYIRAVRALKRRMVKKYGKHIAKEFGV